MADRVYWSGLEPTGPDGRAMVEKNAEHFNTLFNSILLRPTVITNSGNDYTITIDPELNASTDVVPPMNFVVKPNANNSGNVRMRINASPTLPYYPVVKANGDEFGSGQFRSDTNYLLFYLDGKFYSLSDANETDTADDKYKYILTTSGVLDLTAIKAIKHAKTSVHVRMWGGGGGAGGASNGGGGGGGYAEMWFTLDELPNSISYTVGAGGALGAAGGNSVFNAVITAYGGGTYGGTAGGSGGGELAAGGNGTSLKALIGGGAGAVAVGNGGDASTPDGGGGGCSSSSGTTGGAAIRGGGGGGGGTSKYGGNGGVGGANGVAPGGGGGRNGGVGARGEIRVTIF